MIKLLMEMNTPLFDHWQNVIKDQEDNQKADRRERKQKWEALQRSTS